MRKALRASGFTLVELVMVIILISVLSALGAGLFSGRSAFSPLLVTQQLSSATLLAQQAALAGNSSDTLIIRQTDDEFTFTTASSQFSLSRNGSTLAYSVENAPYTNVPAGGLTVEFDDFGRVVSPMVRENINFRIIGDSTFNLCLSSLGAVYGGACR